MVVLDIKRELHHLTAVHRRDQLGNTIHSFAPSLDEEWVAGWNPILDIPKGPLEVAQAQALGWWRTISQTSALGRLSGPWGL